MFSAYYTTAGKNDCPNHQSDTLPATFRLPSCSRLGLLWLALQRHHSAALQESWSRRHRGRASVVLRDYLSFSDGRRPSPQALHKWSQRLIGCQAALLRRCGWHLRLHHETDLEPAKAAMQAAKTPGGRTFLDMWSAISADAAARASGVVQTPVAGRKCSALQREAASLMGDGLDGRHWQQPPSSVAVRRSPNKRRRKEGGPAATAKSISSSSYTIFRRA